MFDTDRPPTAADLFRLITGHRYVFTTEVQLQAAIAAMLTERGIAHAREVPLSGSDRIDLLVDGTGIEVKARKQSVLAVARQLQRYARCDRIDALVLVTTRHTHMTLPSTLGGKPVHVAFLPWNAL